MKMFDIHCHLLPGVDDGANKIHVSKEMLKQAYDNGIRAIICTPHHREGRGTLSVDKLKRAFENIKNVVNSEFPDMRIFLGQEIYYTFDTVEKLNRGELLTMGNSKYVLIEFSHMVQAEHIRDAVYDLYQGGYIPIIAHVERYSELVRKPERVSELIRLGAYIQINAHTITSGFINPIQRFAMRLLKNNEVHFIASDAHDEKYRKTGLSQAVKIVQRRFGQEATRKIFWNNPMSIIKDIEI